MIYQKAMEWFAELYREADKEKSKGTLINGVAIRYLAERIKKKDLKGYQINFLSGFALPLGVKRALDYGKFFERFSNKLSQLKYNQAGVFGQAQSLLMKKDYKNLDDELLKLARIEDNLEELICKQCG